MYKTLNADSIIKTVDILAQRIGERFPESSLSAVAREFTEIARNTRTDADALSKPNWRLRVLTVSVITGGFVMFGFVITELHFQTQLNDVGTLVQILEPAANIAILVAIGMAFIIRMESRWKQRRALTSLHSLRSIIHVIDMHQLTKDPSVILGAVEPTPSSPKRAMSEVEIQRYLDYCSEMLSLTGKLAALYAQTVQDPLVNETVNELESLSTNLTRKIWQKIMMLDRSLSLTRSARPQRRVRKKT